MKRTLIALIAVATLFGCTKKSNSNSNLPYTCTCKIVCKATEGFIKDTNLVTQSLMPQYTGVNLTTQTEALSDCQSQVSGTAPDGTQWLKQIAGADTAYVKNSPVGNGYVTGISCSL